MGRPTAVLALAVLTGLPGCGASSRDAAPMTDQVQVAQVLSSLADVKNNPKSLAGWFAPGAVPPAPELRKYARYTYRADGRPSVSGDTAPAKVWLLEGEREAGVVEWTLVREGDRWKLKSAPLP